MENQSIASELISEVKKANKRLFLLCIFLLIALLGSNIGWLIYNSQFDYVIEGTDNITTQDIDNTSVDNSSIIQY